MSFVRALLSPEGFELLGAGAPAPGENSFYNQKEGWGGDTIQGEVVEGRERTQWGWRYAHRRGHDTHMRVQA